MQQAVTAVVLASALALAAWAQAPQMRAGVSVQMAVTKNASPLPEADQPDAVVVAVTAGGRTYLEITQVTPEQLAAKVPAASRVFVKADARAPFSIVARSLDALRTAGVSATWLLTDQKDAPEPHAIMPPKGLAIRLAPAGPASLVSVRLQSAPQAAFSDVVKVVDACRGVGAEVLLAPSAAPAK